MNEIAHELGSFTGAAVFSAVSWYLGAWITRSITGKPHLATFIGALLALIYASTRDGSAATWGAWLALMVLLVKH